MSIASRSQRHVSVKEFRDCGNPEMVLRQSLIPPPERQYILRMPIRVDGGCFFIPDELAWIMPLMAGAIFHQTETTHHRHPFVYVTVRHGEVASTDDDEWHVDGFSTRVEHVPEQNYIWCSSVPTEYVDNLAVDFPDDFDPDVHNVNKYLQKFVEPGVVRQCEPETLYCMDPYILHRRPVEAVGHRTFVRISFVPIEINDVNNTQNPLLPREYSRDGVERRNQLIEY